jgi:hypothetical protein
MGVHLPDDIGSEVTVDDPQVGLGWRAGIGRLHEERLEAGSAQGVDVRIGATADGKKNRGSLHCPSLTVESGGPVMLGTIVRP